MSRPAPWVVAVAAQAAVEARLTARRGENLLAMVGIPVGMFFVGAVLLPNRGMMETLLPGTFALALVASGLVNLGIATAYERGYGVLKRLGGSPLGKSGLVAAKLGVVVAIAVAQIVALAGLATALGWRPDPDASVPAVALTTMVGSAAFAALGLAIAGTLRPEAALVVANVLFLLTIAFGGLIVPIGDLPAPLPTVWRVLPVGALWEAFAAALGTGPDLVRPLAILATWAVAAFALAARTFRWD